VNGHYALGLLGVDFKLLPQPGDMDIPGACGRGGCVTPDVPQEFLAAERPAEMFKEIAQKLGFFGGEGDRFAMAQNFRRPQIHAERSQIAKVRLAAGDPRSVPGQDLSGSPVCRQTAVPGKVFGQDSQTLVVLI